MAKHWSQQRGWSWFPRELHFTQPMQKGKDVIRWQTFLLNMHCGPSYIDGVFGPDTESCSRKYLTRMGLMSANEYCYIKRITRYRLYLMYWLFNKLYPKTAPIRMALPDYTEDGKQYYGAGKDAARMMREMGIDIPNKKS